MRIRKDWAKRLARIVDDKGGNKKALSKASKLNDTYLRDVLDKGQMPNPRSAQKLSDGLGVKISEWFLEPDQEAEPAALAPGESDYREVPAYDLRAAAGTGLSAEDAPAKHYLMFREPWLRRLTQNISQLIVLEVSGDSMWETLHDGDHALVDRGQINPRREGLYVIRIDEELLVKRISMHPATKLLTIKSDNPAYPTYGEINPDDIAVVGRVIWIGRSLG